MANDEKALVGAGRGPLCSKCVTCHASGSECPVKLAFWWATRAWVPPNVGAGGVDPEADFALVHEIQEKFTDLEMRRREFQQRTLFRSSAPTCGRAAFTSEHTWGCEACLDHSMIELLRWEEKRKKGKRSILLFKHIDDIYVPVRITASIRTLVAVAAASRI